MSEGYETIGKILSTNKPSFSEVVEEAKIMATSQGYSDDIRLIPDLFVCEGNNPGDLIIQVQRDQYNIYAITDAVKRENRTVDYQTIDELASSVLPQLPR